MLGTGREMQIPCSLQPVSCILKCFWRITVKPESLLFAKTHEWVAVTTEGAQKIATVGLTEFAVQALTDLVFIELPKVGQKVRAGESFCEVESVKAVSDVYAPMTGEVIAVNQSLPDNLETLSRDPYGDGWIARIKITDDSALANLMDYAAYQRQIAEESH
jgi:glycine cleavage system H protein